MNVSLFDSLSDELKAKLKACKTEEELNALLESSAIQLDQDTLSAISAGVSCRAEASPICRIVQTPWCPSNG